ncbi:hypothetical protein OAU96_03365 [Planctomycetota bacterium]|nr:hypothetical protein [Planctomycetota bacterium]|tara:strand:- start:300 stop:1853 length:1554 start_codon:yes stop_codon:yes gene_type:complete
MKNKVPLTTEKAQGSAHGVDSGMALFIVLVLVLVLTVVITQMVFVTQVEKRISQNRQGFTQLTYSLQAASRKVVQNVSEDLMEDLGLLEEEILEDEFDSDLDTSNPEEPGTGTPTGNSGGRAGVEAGSSQDEKEVDTRHDTWAYAIQDNINEVNVTGEVIDGESCIDLNHIFELVIEEEEESAADAADGIDLSNLGQAGAVIDQTINGVGDLDSELEEFVIPDQEVVDAAQEMMIRLIEAVVDYNQENGFEYAETPDATGAAESIVTFVYQRVSEESTRRIHSLDALLEIEDVSLELLEGPTDPIALAEAEDAAAANQDGFSSGMTGGMDLESLPGLGSLDFLEQSGYSLLDDMVEAPIAPIGLRHVLTANSSGKINLNTARPEVIISLLSSFEDFEEAKDIAWQIFQQGDTFKEESEEDADAFASEEEEDAAQEFEHFTNINQLGQVNEEWSESTPGEDSILEMLKSDLESKVVFSSKYFTATLKGTKDNRTLSGRLVCARRDRHVIVLSWRELQR